MNSLKKFSVLRITGNKRSRIEETVVTEAKLTIVVNDQKLAILPCSPNELKFLAIGFLFSKGIVTSKKQIKKINLDERNWIVRVETEKDIHLSSLPLNVIYYTSDRTAHSKVKSRISVASHSVFSLLEAFQHRSKIFISTGGVHSVALCEKNEILAFKEDISRNNAIDKLFGECILNDISTAQRMLVTSCRISSEILLKVAKRNIPILISKSAPTDLAVRLASEVGITLIGFVRGKRMNVYANEWRVIS
jgi:FdhD protein